MLYMVTFTINIPQMLAYMPYMDPLGNVSRHLGDDVPNINHDSRVREDRVLS